MHKTWQKKPQKPLLIFDLDGTLIDSVPDIATATNAMLAELGKPQFGTDDIRNWVGNGSRKLVERALYNASHMSEADANKTNQINHDTQAIVETGQPTADEVDAAEAVFFKHYQKDTASKTQPYAGVSQGLQALDNAGYVLALVTNKPARFVPSILQAFAWQGYFKVVLGGDSLAEKKPSPLPLQHVCEALDQPASQAYMIGDSKNDILAGQNAGMDTLALSYGYNYGQDIREFNPNHTFDTFNDMVAFLLADV